MNQIPKAVWLAFESFRVHSDRELRLVGGCVRDLLLGKTPKDWDMCTPAKPAEIMQILEAHDLKPYDISNGHGTVCFKYEDEVIEITTLRVDVKTDGRHAEVEFVEDFKLDAARRDFTINAMSMSSNGQVHDYFGGSLDLAFGTVRFVGDADERIKEDYLRILRFYRFVGRYDQVGPQVNVDSRDPIRRNVEGLKQISGERVWMEMQQIFGGPNSQKVVNMMQADGVFETLGIKLKD